MIDYLPTVKTESKDAFIAIASFHHLPSRKERLFALKHMYRALRYGGKICFTNWALSGWMLKRHWKVLLKAVWHTLLSRGKTSRRDFFIPRKSEKQTYYRYYHLFALSEIS